MSSIIIIIRTRTQPVPRPLLRLLGFQCSMQHLHDVGADDGQEFPRVEGSTDGQVEMSAMSVRRDDRTLVQCVCVPWLD